MDSNDERFDEEELLNEEENQEELLEEESPYENEYVNNNYIPNNNKSGNRYFNNRVKNTKKEEPNTNDKLGKGMNGYKPNKLSDNKPSQNNKPTPNLPNKGANNKGMPGGGKLETAQKALNAAQKAEEEGKNKQIAVGKELLKEKIKQKIMAFVIANLPVILLVILILIIIIILTVLIFMFIDDYESQQNTTPDSLCSAISLRETEFTRDEFIEKVEYSSTIQTFKTNAGKIYDIATRNNINPELVIIRGKVEGYSPSVGNNYWGLGCFNGVKKCFSYPSFDQGLFEYIKNISRYTSLEDMLNHYANIGEYWFNTSKTNNENTGLGGCYYFPYLQEYLSEERKSAVAAACTEGRWCYNHGVGDCLKTTDEDQMAYTKWQVSRMVYEREAIFGVGEDACDEEFSDTEIPDDGSLGSQAANYAIETFDSFSYSQDANLRWSNEYVDCSSLVYRVYAHFGYKFGGNSTAGTEYQWCKANDKEMSESELK